MISGIDVVLRSVLFVLVRLYQRTLSPLLIPSCRFEPSCSHYALEVLQMWPLGRGLWLIVRRLARCQPLCKGGLDPVPVYRGHGGHRVLSGGWIGVGPVVPPDTAAGCRAEEGHCSHG